MTCLDPSDCYPTITLPRLTFCWVLATQAQSDSVDPHFYWRNFFDDLLAEEDLEGSGTAQFSDVLAKMKGEPHVLSMQTFKAIVCKQLGLKTGVECLRTHLNERQFMRAITTSTNKNVILPGRKVSHPSAIESLTAMKDEIKAIKEDARKDAKKVWVGVKGIFHGAKDDKGDKDKETKDIKDETIRPEN